MLEGTVERSTYGVADRSSSSVATRRRFKQTFELALEDGSYVIVALARTRRARAARRRPARRLPRGHRGARAASG